MRRVFAENFLVPQLEPEQREPELHYDEARSLNVMSDGRPFIETGSTGRTDTLTEVRAEQDDFDDPHDDEYILGQFGTVTKVKAERDDFAAPAGTFATETRQVPGEREDFCRTEALLGTETAADGEADDFARSEAVAGTKTSVRAEADDFSRELEEASGRDVVLS